MADLALESHDHSLISERLGNKLQRSNITKLLEVSAWNMACLNELHNTITCSHGMPFVAGVAHMRTRVSKWSSALRFRSETVSLLVFFQVPGALQQFKRAIQTRTNSRWYLESGMNAPFTLRCTIFSHFAFTKSADFLSTFRFVYDYHT